MIDPKYIELINRDLDDLLTIEEKKKLHHYLEDHPEARTYYNQIKRTSEILGEVQPVEPPPSLKKRIINAIDYNRYRPESTIKHTFKNWLTSPRLRLAYAFALGIFVGFLIYTAISPRQTVLDLEDLYGTIGAEEQMGFQTIENIPMDTEQASGTIEILKRENIISCQIEFDTEQEFELLLGYDKNILTYMGISSEDQEHLTFELEQNLLKFMSAENFQQIIFFNQVNPVKTELRFKLTITEEPVWQHLTVISQEK
jgi:hypothetical protein